MDHNDLNYPLREKPKRLKEKVDYIFASFDMWDVLTNYFPGYHLKRNIQKEGFSTKVTTYFKTVCK